MIKAVLLTLLTSGCQSAKLVELTLDNKKDLTGLDQTEFLL